MFTNITIVFNPQFCLNIGPVSHLRWTYCCSKFALGFNPIVLYCRYNCTCLIIVYTVPVVSKTLIGMHVHRHTRETWLKQFLIFSYLYFTYVYTYFTFLKLYSIIDIKKFLVQSCSRQKPIHPKQKRTTWTFFGGRGILLPKNYQISTVTKYDKFKISF